MLLKGHCLVVELVPFESWERQSSAEKLEGRQKGKKWASKQMWKEVQIIASCPRCDFQEVLLIISWHLAHNKHRKQGENNPIVYSGGFYLKYYWLCFLPVYLKEQNAPSGSNKKKKKKVIFKLGLAFMDAFLWLKAFWNIFLYFISLVIWCIFSPHLISVGPRRDHSDENSATWHLV